MKQALSALLLAFLFILSAPVAYAQDQATPNDLPTDLLRMAPEVVLTDPVTRDAVLAGGTIIVDAPVAADVLAVGGSVGIRAAVGADVRVASGEAIITGPVGGNVTIWAGRVVISEEARISGSVAIMAGEVELLGPVAGDVQIRAQRVVMNALVEGNADIAVPQGSDLILGEKAVISGTLSYRAAGQAQFNPSQAGEVVFNEQPLRQPWQQIMRIARVAWLFGLLLVGLVVVSVAPHVVRSAVTRSMVSPLPDFLWGLGVLILGPLAIALIAVTIIGLPLALILLAAYVIAAYLGQVFVGTALGLYILGAIRGRERRDTTSLVLAMVLGVVVLRLIAGIPGFGPFITLVAVVWGVGMLVSLKRTVFQRLEHTQ